jgi:hypothetical protein
MAAPDQEPTPKKLRTPARLAKPGAPGGATLEIVDVGPEPQPAAVIEPDPLSHETAPDASPTYASPTDTGSDQGGERVVLAVGSTYFHNGRVSPELYASDLAPSFTGAIAASHTLLRDLFKEMGAPEGALIQAACDRWHLRYGAEMHQAQFSVDEQVTTDPAGSAPVAGEGAGADSWVRGIVAARDADHAQALAAFEAEAAEATEAGAPQRAAIAYRAAAAAALAAGRGDHANRLQRLAGKAYLEIAEKSETLPQGVFMAYRESARSFLEAGNLPLAHKCLSKAIAIGETLGYTESA